MVSSRPPIGETLHLKALVLEPLSLGITARQRAGMMQS